MSAERVEFLRSELAWLREQRVSSLDVPSWERSRYERMRLDDIAAAERELVSLGETTGDRSDG